MINVKIHKNELYIFYCIDCNKHLCKECIKLREHYNHNKNYIPEIQPNKNELNHIENIIKYYDNQIDKLNKEKLNKTKEITKKYKEYKNLHASYLQMADEFFGDDNVNPSVIKEFEMFGNNVGMFTGENPQVGEDMGKKYYSNVEKKYSFVNGGEDTDKIKKFKKKKISKSERIKNEDEPEIFEENSKKNKSYRRDPFEKYKKK